MFICFYTLTLTLTLTLLAEDVFTCMNWWRNLTLTGPGEAGVPSRLTGGGLAPGCCHVICQGGLKIEHPLSHTRPLSLSLKRLSGGTFQAQVDVYMFLHPNPNPNPNPACRRCIYLYELVAEPNPNRPR